MSGIVNVSHTALLWRSARYSGKGSNSASRGASRAADRPDPPLPAAALAAPYVVHGRCARIAASASNPSNPGTELAGVSSIAMGGHVGCIVVVGGGGDDDGNADADGDGGGKSQQVANE